MNKSKYHPKNKLAINISPFFFVCHWPSIYTRGHGGRMGWRSAEGEVADDAKMVGRGNTR
jgi:hypothetical protein